MISGSSTTIRYRTRRAGRAIGTALAGTRTRCRLPPAKELPRLGLTSCGSSATAISSFTCSTDRYAARSNVAPERRLTPWFGTVTGDRDDLPGAEVRVGPPRPDGQRMLHR